MKRILCSCLPVFLFFGSAFANDPSPIPDQKSVVIVAEPVKDEPKSVDAAKKSDGSNETVKVKIPKTKTDQSVPPSVSVVDLDDEYYVVILKKKPVPSSINAETVAPKQDQEPVPPENKRYFYLRGGANFMLSPKLKVSDNHSTGHAWYGHDNITRDYSFDMHNTSGGWNAGVGGRFCHGTGCLGYVELELGYSVDRYAGTMNVGNKSYALDGRANEYNAWMIFGLKPGLMGLRFGGGAGYMQWDLWNGRVYGGTIAGLAGLEFSLTEYFSITGDFIFRVSPYGHRYKTHQYTSGFWTYDCDIDSKIKLMGPDFRLSARVLF